MKWFIYATIIVMCNLVLVASVAGILALLFKHPDENFFIVTLVLIFAILGLRSLFQIIIDPYVDAYKLYKKDRNQND